MLQAILYASGPIVLLVYLCKRYFGGGVCTSQKRLDGKVVIVTGANAGIGYETALDLAKRGARVILACRDMNRANKAVDNIIAEYPNAKVEVELLDLGNLKSVKEFCERIKKKLNRLDILINNGGITYQANLKTVDGFDARFQVNHLSHFYITLTLIDLLKTSAPSRVVSVSSKLFETVSLEWDDLNCDKNFAVMKSYSQSKLAKVLFTKELAKRYKDAGITSVCLHPGVIRSDIWQNLNTNYKIVSILYKMLTPVMWLFLKDTKQGAQTTIYCAVDDQVPEHNGGFFIDCKLTPTKNKDINAESAERMWKVSSKMLNLE